MISPRKYILNIFKRHNIKKLNNKTVPANKIEILIAEFEIKFKENPIISFRNKLKTKVSNKKGYVYIIGNLDENICKIGFSGERYSLSEFFLPEVKPYNLYGFNGKSHLLGIC